MTRRVRRMAAVPALLALLLQGLGSGALACVAVGAGAAPSSGHEGHYTAAPQAPDAHSQATMAAAAFVDGMSGQMVGEQSDDSGRPNPCTMLGHCSGSLTTQGTFILAALSQRAPVAAAPGWVLHGAPEFGLTPPPKV